MGSALLRRLAWAIPTLLIVTFIVFLMLDVAPGDPARVLAGNDAPPEVIEEFQRQLGLDKPLPQRYVDWVGDAARGNLQRSMVSDQPVKDMVLEALPPTISLVAVALTFSILIGFGLGVLPSLVPRGPVDRITTFLSALAVSVPSFWLALLLALAFAVDRTWLPAIGYVPLAEGPWDWLRHLILPGLALSMVTAGEIARQLRGALQDELGKDFVLAARAKGLPNRRVVLKHGVKNAAVPVVTVLGVRLAGMLGGTAVIEQVFLIDGVGRLTVAAVGTADIPVVLGVVFVTTAMVLFLNLFIDASYGYFNPRVRTS